MSNTNFTDENIDLTSLLIEEFKKQPVDKQEEIAKLSVLHRGHSIEKLPNESDFDFRVRSFYLLFVNLPPGSLYFTEFGHISYTPFKYSMVSPDITDAFRNLPVDKQEDEIGKLSNSVLLQGARIPPIQKLPFESENDFRVRFFSELFVRLRPNSDYEVTFLPIISSDHLFSTRICEETNSAPVRRPRIGQNPSHIAPVRRPIYSIQNYSKTPDEHGISKSTSGNGFGGFNPNYSNPSHN